MIEMALGLLVLVAAVAAALGLGQSLFSAYFMVPAPMLMTAAMLAAFVGLLLFSHGLYRMRLRRVPGARYWTRSSGLMWTALAFLFVLAFALPLMAPFLNILKVAGYPLGFYMSAQGSLILIVALLFAFVARADAIDDQEGAREE